MKKVMFELSRVFDNGEQESPQIVPLSEAVESAKMGRRDFLKVGLTASAALALLNSCGIQKLSNAAASASDCNAFAHDGSVTALAISSDGKLLLSAGEDNIIKFWELPAGALIKTISNIPATTSLAISPIGNMFATRGLNNSIQLRSLSDGELIKILEGHSSVVNSLKFSSDGKFLVSGSSDSSVLIWDVSEENQYRYQKIMWHKDSVRTVAVSSNKNTWASGSDDTAIVVGDFDGNITIVLTGHKSAVVSLEFSSDGRYLASISNDNTIIIWDLLKGVSVKQMNPDMEKNHYLHSLSFKNMLIAKNNENEITLWNFPKFDSIKKIKSKVNIFSVTPDEKLLIAGKKEKTIQIRSLPNGKLVKCLMDLKCSPSTVKGITYTSTNEYGQLITYTLPCGSPIPPGATCVCNCVPGSVCSCNKVCTCQSVSQRCTCNKVCTCQSVSKRCTCNKVCTCQSVSRGSYCRCNLVCSCLSVYR